jgi:hypothetical protein
MEPVIEAANAAKLGHVAGYAPRPSGAVQDRLSGSSGNLDVAGGAEAVGNELDQLLKHAQGMKMGLKEAVEFFAVLIVGRVFPVYKAEEVPRHRSPLFGSRWEPICRARL